MEKCIGTYLSIDIGVIDASLESNLLADDREVLQLSKMNER